MGRVRIADSAKNMFASWLLAVCIVGAVCLQSQMSASLTVHNHRLRPVYEWKYIDFLYRSKAHEAAVKNETGYDKKKNIPIDVARTIHGRTFVTIPRDKGVPSCLNTVSDQHGDGGPLLKPYPNWDAAKTDCSGIYSVYRVAICMNVLYVVDNGQSSDGVQVCPPRLYMFDLVTDKILKNLTIPMDVATNTTTNTGLLITPIVPCCNSNDRNVYIADVAGYAIVVYHHATGKFCRVTGGPLNYDPKATTYTIENESFELKDGVVGMAFSCPRQTLALSPMSSYNLVFIHQSDLDNSCGDVPMRNFQDILPTQSSAKAISSRGILFFGLVNSTSIACWNERRPLVQDYINIVAQNREQLQFTSGMKIEQHISWIGSEEYLYALSDRYQKAVGGTLNVNEINFRILRGTVSELVHGTRCAGYFEVYNPTIAPTYPFQHARPRATLTSVPLWIVDYVNHSRLWWRYGLVPQYHSLGISARRTGGTRGRRHCVVMENMYVHIHIPLLPFLCRIVRCSTSLSSIAWKEGALNMFASWLVLVAVCVVVGAVCLQSGLAQDLKIDDNHPLDVVFKWNYLDFLYENEVEEEIIMEITGYVPEKNIPIDVDVAPDGRVFVTILKDVGVPSSLNTVSDQRGDGGLLLKPYPSWDVIRPDCSGIHSVVRVAICKDVLYAVDNGQIGDVQICPPRLYLFDLKTDKILKNLTIPTDVAVNTTIAQGQLVTPIVDCCASNGTNANVYIADVTGYAIVVYHHATGKFCRVTGGPLNYDPNAVTFTIEDESFQLVDGPVGMALSCSSKKLYMSPLVSYDLVAIRQTDLDGTCGDAPMKNYTHILPTQSIAKAMSRLGAVFFSLVGSTSIACWNERRPLVRDNMIIIAKDSERLQFVSGLKVRQSGTEEHLWALSNRFQKYGNNDMNFTEVNFRILRGTVSNLISDTPCIAPFVLG
ncbi:uncharacterized protein LOC143211889 [Lasioglossum baleicum]|uniref:uncharacterized protein LOC143211889 n=1 Tax=Lasioglossum baleicum TaxID=434251 RepID=UPI003FCE2B60